MLCRGTSSPLFCTYYHTYTMMTYSIVLFCDLKKAHISTLLTLFYLILSYFILSYFTLSYLILSYHILSYHILSYLLSYYSPSLLFSPFFLSFTLLYPLSPLFSSLSFHISLSPSPLFSLSPPLNFTCKS